MKLYNLEKIDKSNLKILKDYLYQNTTEYNYFLNIPYQNSYIKFNINNALLNYFDKIKTNKNLMKFTSTNEFTFKNSNYNNLINYIKKIDPIHKDFITSATRMRVWVNTNSINLEKLKELKNIFIISTDMKYTNFLGIFSSDVETENFLNEFTKDLKENPFYEITFLNKDYSFISISSTDFCRGFYLNESTLIYPDKDIYVDFVTKGTLNDFIIDIIFSYYEKWTDKDFIMYDNQRDLFNFISIQKDEKDFIYISRQGYFSCLYVSDEDIFKLQKLGFNFSPLDFVHDFSTHFGEIFLSLYSNDIVGYPIDNDFINELAHELEKNPNILFDN